MWDFYNLVCSIDVHARECSSATLETAIGAPISRAICAAWSFALICNRHRPRTRYLISSCLRRGGGPCSLAISRVVPVAGSPHKESVPVDEISSTGGPLRGALLLRPPRSSPHRRRKPHPEHELPTTHLLQPGWYALVHNGQSYTPRSPKTA